MNSKQTKALEAIFDLPVNGRIEWSRVESLLIALGCKVIEGPGSSITVAHSGRRATFHRPHPGKEALRYRIVAARDFIERIGMKP
jgi:HicA toxin of bacterial toxin-antitoxin,